VVSVTETETPLDDGFDWRETGPFELARNLLDDARAFGRENAPYVIAAAVVIVVASWHYDISLPEVPTWAKVSLLGFILAVPIGTVTGVKLARALHSPDTKLLSVQNPVTGDQELVHIAPDRFEDMTVMNHNGDERDRTFLHEVVINGRRAYEVDSYEREENLAVASWQAGVPNTAIRKDRAQIKNIKTDLEKQADKSLELLANHPEIIRKQGALVANRLVEVAERVESPGADGLHEELGDVLDAADPSEELLEGDLRADDETGNEVSDASSPDGDIFARAAQQMTAGDADANGTEETDE
jgi:hypothetical protein